MEIFIFEWIENIIENDEEYEEDFKEEILAKNEKDAKEKFTHLFPDVPLDWVLICRKNEILVTSKNVTKKEILQAITKLRKMVNDNDITGAKNEIEFVKELLNNYE